MILALTDRRAPHRSDRADDLHKFYHDPASFKELSDNRDRYIEQSRNTKYGVAAPLPPRRQAQALP